MEDALKLLKIPKSECPDIWIRPPRYNLIGLNHGPVWKIQSFFLKGICMVIFWHEYYGKDNLEKILLQHGSEKVSNLECLFVHREKRLFLSVYVDDIKLAGKKQNLKPMWKLLNEEVDLGEPTSFLDHVYFRVYSTTTPNKQRYCGQLQNHVRIENFSGRTEKLPSPQNLRISSWSYDMEGHAMKCVERYCELANKTTQQNYKVSTPCIDDHHFKEEEMKSVGELSQVCSQIVLKW